MKNIQLSPKLLLIAIPGSVGFGMAIIPTQVSQSQSQTVEMPTEWKIKTVAAPKLDKQSIHQAFLDRQKQLKDREFSCDCNGCRITAAQMGITIN
jgi:ribonuclease I